MKNHKTQCVFRHFTLLASLMVFAQSAWASSDDYTFINKKEAIDTVLDTRALSQAESYTEQQLEEQNLALGDKKYLVFSFRDIAIWIPRPADFNTDIDEKNSGQRNALKRLDELTKKAALEKALSKVDEEEGSPNSKSELDDLATDLLSRFEGLLAPSDGMRRMDTRVDRDGIFSNNQFIIANYYFRFDRESLLDEIVPSPITTEFEGPSIDPADFSSDTHYVLRFTDRTYPVDKKVKGREAAWKATFDKAIAALSEEAFKEAVYEVNKGLRYPQQKQGLIDLIEQHTRSGQDSFQLYTGDYQIRKQQIVRVRSKDTLHLSVYFYLERQVLKALIKPPERTVELAVSEADIAGSSIPSSDENAYVAVFRDHTAQVPENMKDQSAARERAKSTAVDNLRAQALRQAAEDINHQLSQPVDSGEFNRVVSKATANHPLYITEFKWIGRPVVVTHGTYSTEPESLRLSVYFKVDRGALQDRLIADRAITVVGKYRTYVEVFWNVPNKNVHPEVVATVVGTIEDQFRQAGYEVVEFERIRGDLVELLKAEGGDVDELYSADELKRFKANLELRNIDKRFESGKRILADYADLLVGVTINSIDVLNQELTVRVTTNATLFEKGEWQKLAHADSAETVAHVKGSTDNLIAAAKSVTLKSTRELQPKVQNELGLRTERGKQQKQTSREFSLVFSGVDKQSFNKIRSKLSKGSKWTYQAADFKQRVVYVDYKGTADSLSDLVQFYLEGGDIASGVGEFSTGRNKIIFGGQ